MNKNSIKYKIYEGNTSEAKHEYFINFDKVATQFVEDIKGRSEKNKNFIGSRTYNMLINFLYFRFLLDDYNVNQNLNNLTEKDAKEFISHIAEKEYPNIKKEQMISAVKVFFRWVKNNYKNINDVKERLQFGRKVQRIFK